MDYMFSSSFCSAFRAICLVLITIFSIHKLPMWISFSLRVSPILAILLVLFVVYILGQLWKKYSTDVNITLFRSLLNIINVLKDFRRDFNRLRNEDTAEERKHLQKKFIQMLVFFLMAQHCIVPSVNMLWLYTILAYKFITDSICVLCSLNVFSDASQSVVVPVNYHYIVIFKVLYSVCFLIYTSFYVSLGYIIVTSLYFLIAQHYFEMFFIKQLEMLQLDFFEGMEQFYVRGFLSCIEILCAIIFMIWSLISEKQMLMLVALYTNIYQGIKDIVNITMSVALVEWTYLAQFERASKNELSNHDDVCAVCLSGMKSARKTPCKHFFHGHCLRKCLKEKQSCPMCNTQLIVN